MKKMLFPALVVSLLAGLPSESADAAQGVFPPAATMFAGDCFTKLASGAVRGAYNTQACPLNNWHALTMGLPYLPNQGGGIDVYWRSTVPSGASVRGRGRNYNQDGVLYSVDAWVTGSGNKSQTVNRTFGTVVFDWQFQTNSSSALPTLQYVSHNLM